MFIPLSVLFAGGIIVLGLVIALLRAHVKIHHLTRVVDELEGIPPQEDDGG